MPYSMPSTIELFPAELFYELFKYFNAVELFGTFGKLNSNMDAIVSAAALHLKLARPSDYRICHANSILETSNLSLIKSLYLAWEWDSAPQQLELFLKLFHLNAFNQLHSLTLILSGILDPSKCEALPMEIAHLTQLEYLHIKASSYYKEYFAPIITLIFDERSGYGFGTLKQLVFEVDCYANKYFTLSSSIQKKTKIEHLTMDYIDFSEFMQLVPCLSQVKSVKFDYLRIEDNHSLPMALFLPNCTSFLVRFSSNMKADHLRFLLRCIPNLTNLQFSADRDDYKPTDFEELFQQGCPKLRKLKLQVYFNSKYIRNMDEYSRVFETSSWWTQRQAKVSGTEIEYGADGCLDEVTVKFDLKVSSSQLATAYPAYCQWYI